MHIAKMHNSLNELSLPISFVMHIGRFDCSKMYKSQFAKILQLAGVTNLGCALTDSIFFVMYPCTTLLYIYSQLRYIGCSGYIQCLLLDLKHFKVVMQQLLNITQYNLYRKLLHINRGRVKAVGVGGGQKLGIFNLASGVP